jgi:hypothetical protein
MYGGATNSEIARNAILFAGCFSSRKVHSRSLLLTASDAQTQASTVSAPDFNGEAINFLFKQL